jgi:hypothetical protein
MATSTPVRIAAVSTNVTAGLWAPAKRSARIPSTAGTIDASVT